MSRRPLLVLVVAADRTLLRHLSKFLGVFGYRVQQAADADQARAALDSGRPEFLIVDDNLPGALELCRQASDDESLPYVYSLLLTQRSDPADVADALKSGFDDFLARPVVYGELLARLRAGARLREFERRWRDRLGLDAVTGLPNRRAFTEHLATVAENVSGSRDHVACALVDVDFFLRLPLSHGTRTADQVRARVAQLLVRQAPESAFAACFGRDRFALLLPNHTVVEAEQWAETLRQTVADEDFGGDDSPLQLTVSVGLADCEFGPPALLDIVSQAEAALESAKHSGRDCVARYGQFDEEAAAWAELATPGRLFEHTVARDVMTPCTVTLNVEDSVDQAAAVLRQTRFFAVPVVDENGQLAGVITQETDWNRLSGSWRGKRAVREVMNAHPISENEYTSFAALVDLFAGESTSVVVIVDGGRPTGLVTCDNLASLSEPLHTESFAPDAVDAADASSPTQYMLVDDYCTVAEDD